MDAEKVYNRLKSGLSWLLSAHCCLCAAPVRHGRELCDSCHADLPWIRAACPRCGEALPDQAPSVACGRCLRQPQAFDEVLAPLRFAAPVNRLIHAFKFRGDLAAGRLLTELLADAAARRFPDLLLPVPLHPRRMRQRGFNQSLEIARQLGRSHRIPVASTLLSRIRDTPPQHTQPAKRRRANIRGAFQVNRELSGAHVALIDDVLTTGHTAAEIAHTLKRAGAARVEVWVVARA
jgi:ComF family protein